MTGQYIYNPALENSLRDIARELHRLNNNLEAQEKRARKADEDEIRLARRLAGDMDAAGFTTPEDIKRAGEAVAAVKRGFASLEGDEPSG